MDIKKVANLAHLELTDAEAALYSPQMEDIVAYVEQLNELDTDNVEVSIGGLTRESENTKADRDDVKAKSLGQEKALEQAPSAVDGHFQVPKIL